MTSSAASGRRSRSRSSRSPTAPASGVCSATTTCVEVSRHPAQFGSNPSVFIRQPPDGDSTGTSELLINLDPPRHTQLRKLVNRGFTPRQITVLEPRDPRARASTCSTPAKARRRLRSRHRRRGRGAVAGDRRARRRPEGGPAQGLRVDRTHDEQRDADAETITADARVRDGGDVRLRRHARGRAGPTATATTSSACSCGPRSTATALTQLDVDVFFMLLDESPATRPPATSSPAARSRCSSTPTSGPGSRPTRRCSRRRSRRCCAGSHR